MLLLRGLHMDLLIHKLTRSELQCRGSSSESTRDICRRTELTSFRARAGEVGVMKTLFRDRSTGRCHCSLVEPFHDTHSQDMQVGAKSDFSINLANIFHPALVIP